MEQFHSPITYQQLTHALSNSLKPKHLGITKSKQTYSYIQTYKHIHIYIHIHIRKHINTHTHTYTHIRIHIHTL